MGQQSGRQNSVNHATEQEKEKNNLKNEDIFRDLWDKCTNVYIVSVPEGGKREKGAENLFEEIVAEHFLTWGRKEISRSRKHRESQGEPKETNNNTYN